MLYIIVMRNASLTNLAGLDSLTNAIAVDISDNESLVSVSGLDALVDVTVGITISDNRTLPSCAAQAVIDRLILGGFTGKTNLTGNDDSAGC